MNPKTKLPKHWNNLHLTVYSFLESDDLIQINDLLRSYKVAKNNPLLKGLPATTVRTVVEVLEYIIEEEIGMAIKNARTGELQQLVYIFLY